MVLWGVFVFCIRGGGGGMYKTKILVNFTDNWKILLFLTHPRSRYPFLAIQLYVILRRGGGEGSLFWCLTRSSFSTHSFTDT